MKHEGLLRDSACRLFKVIEMINSISRHLEDDESNIEKKALAINDLSEVNKEVRQIGLLLDEIGNDTEKCRTVEGVLRNIESTMNFINLREIFEEFRILKIREAVIDKMSFDTVEACDWAENMIYRLSMSSERDLCVKLFERYGQYGLMSPKRFEIVNRALEFVVGGLDEPGYVSDKLVYKITNTAIKENERSWWEVPSIREVIQRMLFAILPSGNVAKKSYKGDEWIRTQQAVDRIMQMKDITYIPDIKKLCELIEFGELVPDKNFGCFAAKEQHLAILKKSLSDLAGERINQWPHLESLVRSLEGKCGLRDFSIRLFPLGYDLENGLECGYADWGCIIADPGKELRVVMDITCRPETNPDLFGRVATKLVMPELIFGARALGFKNMVPTPIFPVENPSSCSWPHNSAFRLHRNTNKGATYRAGLVMTPTKGHNRLSIDVRIRDKKIFEGMLYVIGEPRVQKGSDQNL